MEKKIKGSNGFRKRISVSDVILSVVLILFALIIIYPFYNAVLISMVPMTEYVRNPMMLWPERFTFDSYEFVFSYKSIWSGMRVTGLITVLGTLYNMLMTVTGAYIMCKTFPGKRILQAMLIIPLYFGGGLVPNYLLIRNLGMMDTLWAMILPTGLNYTYMLVVMRYIEGLPRELEEAAEIDGAGVLTKLFVVVLPLALPILATYTLYYAVDRWNEWWNGMLFVKSTGNQPLQLILRNLVQDSTDATQDAMANGMTETYSDAIKMASIIVTMVPIMVLYPFLQRYFLAGLTNGAVKG